MASRKRFQFLTKYVPELFGTWSRAKINELNESFVTTQLFKTGDLIYDIGQPAEVFYIVREGKLEFETVIEAETAYKLPVDGKNWEVTRTKKTIQYHIRLINSGDYFGHEEILCGLTDRQTRVKCKSSCQILLINKEDVLRHFPRETLSSIRSKHCQLIDLDFILKNIEKYSKLRKQQNQAILDALNINPSYHTSGSRKQQQQQDQDVSEYKRIERVKPWLQQAHQNVTNSSKIIRETNRVKLLGVKHVQYKVARADIETKEEERRFEESLLPRARFSKNYYAERVDQARGLGQGTDVMECAHSHGASPQDMSIDLGSQASSQESPARNE